jgi:hypothetical protein
MPLIYSCEFVPSNLPAIEPIEAPLPFRSIIEFERWLRDVYIPRTLIPRIIDDPRFPYIVDANKTECWGIFSFDGACKKCCQTYASTDLSQFPDFETFLRGKIFSHNHSKKSTLSINEVVLWAFLQIIEFRSVTEECTYLIKPINHEWPDPERLTNRINEVCRSIILENPTYSNKEMRHKCYQILAGEGFFIYEIV